MRPVMFPPETPLPQGWRMTPRPVHDPRQDDCPLLIDAEGRVLAVVEAWLPN